MTEERRRRWKARQRQRGAALLITAWLFIVLFVVVLDFATSMRDDGLATANFADETQSYYIALAGLNRAVYDAMGHLEDDPDAFGQDDLDGGGEPGDDLDAEDDPEPPDVDDLDDFLGAGEAGEPLETVFSTDGSWHEGSFAVGSYRVRTLDEASKISLNRASEALLMRIVRRLVVGGNATEGVSVKEERQVSEIVHAILDWRDPDDLENLNGAEADYYASLPRPYPIKNAPFDSVEELLLVRGVTPDLYYGTQDEVGLSEIFSVFNRTESVNVMQAPAAVLRVLLDLDREEAEQLVQEREENSFGFVERVREMMMAIDPNLATVLRGGMSPVVTVEATGRIGERNVAHVAAIVDLSDAFEGPRVFRWLDRVPAGWNPGAALDDAGAQAADGA